MNNAIHTLRIQNFKSIKDVEMKPRRVNIIIGEPNVGKSNVLEAISLLGGMVYDRGEKFMGEMIRYERASQLFYDNLSSNTIAVVSDQSACIIAASSWGGKHYQALYLDADSFNGYLRLHDMAPTYLEASRRIVASMDRADVSRWESPSPSARAGFGFRGINEDGKSASSSRIGFDSYSQYITDKVTVRPYLFRKGAEVGKDSGTTFLMPPHGTNLKAIIQTYPKLRQEVAAMFRRYGLKLSLRMASDELEVVKEMGELTYSYPYSSIADTLQRLIFYLAAIESNDDMVLLLEEPEAHSHPEYVSQLARRIVSSRSNQFFIATHSPYLITETLENMLPKDELAPELAIFAAYYDDYQTKIRQLTDEEVQAIRADGLDVFYNMARFVPETGE